MQIKKVLIQNFRSINCSDEILLDKKITILIGKNEYGKTNFLKALESFTIGHEYVDEDLCTYCSAKEKLETGSVERSDIPIITIWFTLESDDKTKLGEVHEKLAQLEELKVTKFFDNRYEIGSGKLDISALESVPIINIDKLNSWPKVQSQIDALRNDLKAQIGRLPSFASAEPQCDQHITNFLALGSENTDESIEKAFDTLFQGLSALPNQDGTIQNAITNRIGHFESVKQSLKVELADKTSAQNEVSSQVLDTMPSFIYFTDVDLLQDNVPLSKFLGNRQQYRTLDNLITLAELDVNKLGQVSPHARRFQTDKASAVITGLVNNFWKQQKVTVTIGIDADNLSIFVTDDVGAFDPPSRRSKGFQWFLSFYVNFTAGSKNELKNAVLLLDDPGVFLHPLGQEDLKKTLEQLSASNQLVFATHSPFMIYRDHLERTRIVDKESEEGGTKLIEKYWVSDFDAIAPLRAALGIRLGEMPLAEKRHLVVEGYEDLLYLEAMALYFRRAKKKPIIDLSRMLILPVNGADRAPFYTTFLVKEGFKLLVLLDYDQKGRAVKKEIIENQLVPEDMVVTLDEAIVSTESGRDYEIEDLFDVDFYKHAATQVYQRETEDGTIDFGNLDPSIKKQTKRYKQLFKTNKLSFDELRIAQQIRMIIDSESCNDRLVGEATLVNFGKLFEIINERLK
ncbi:MAG: AAA family ATPase [Dehalococcoidia bacterium]|nr:AAA family ATPase [Dehalococcoidia bacterium]